MIFWINIFYKFEWIELKLLKAKSQIIWEFWVEIGRKCWEFPNGIFEANVNKLDQWYEKWDNWEKWMNNKQFISLFCIFEFLNIWLIFMNIWLIFMKFSNNFNCFSWVIKLTFIEEFVWNTSNLDSSNLRLKHLVPSKRPFLG